MVEKKDLLKEKTFVAKEQVRGLAQEKKERIKNKIIDKKAKTLAKFNFKSE